jgi:hypothetical protein
VPTGLTNNAQRRKTHCPQGHEYTPENTGWRPGRSGNGPTRRCLQCHNNRERERWASLTPEEKYAESLKKYAMPSRAKSKDYQRAYRMRHIYHTTDEQIAELREDQDGLCAICYGLAPASHIDHDHATGEVRGLLCNACNRGLGYFHDDPDALRAAADYLERGRLQ